MGDYYLDASALVKRYVVEPGTVWVRELCTARQQEADENLHRIIVGEISRVEVASAFARKSKKTNEISEQKAEQSYDLFLSHFEEEYESVGLTSDLIGAAADLARKHALRAYDAVQLALAIHANNLLKQEELSITFVTADKTLLQAARIEGLAVENPNEHAQPTTG
ncbi:MAG: type II toxin-antitoxin system VapC family toxin [Chloroflexi bacterium]|nr:type II toxin-antitoxin system VapC family toxin [Chloroflexota bacterium]